MMRQLGLMILMMLPIVAGASREASSSVLLQHPVLLDMEHRALRYFLENAHPESGLVLDRAHNFTANPAENRVASIASTGFGLAVVANAAARGLVERDEAYRYLVRALRFSESSVERYRGWFLHFVDWQTGERMWQSEYSTIDTALFVAGALYAAEVFPNSEISERAERIYEQVDFIDMLTDGGTQPNKKTLSMGYRKEQGYIHTQWAMHAEQKILLLLGLGHPSRPLPREAWFAFDRSLQTTPVRTPHGEMNIMGLNEALFVHQYSELFVDFRQVQDGVADYFQNSVDITRYHRDLMLVDSRYQTLREGFWGFSAGDAPGEVYEVYTALRYKSTVCIGCAVGSLMFLPEEISRDVIRWVEGPYSHRLWGRYGFVDGLDLDQDWFSPWVLGITVGPVYMSMANTNERTSVWQTFMKTPAMKRALNRIQNRAF